MKEVDRGVLSTGAPNSLLVTCKHKKKNYWRRWEKNVCVWIEHPNTRKIFFGMQFEYSDLPLLSYNGFNFIQVIGLIGSKWLKKSPYNDQWRNLLLLYVYNFISRI